MHGNINIPSTTTKKKRKQLKRQTFNLHINKKGGNKREREKLASIYKKQI
jgi:zona occludens toxin (predicted ATPase)